MLIDQIEEFIIKYLFTDDTYFKLMCPYLEEKYVKDQTTKLVFRKVNMYINQYKNRPTFNEIMSDILKDTEIYGDLKNDALKNLEAIRKTDYTIANPDWIKNETESHFKKVLLYDMILESADLINKKKNEALNSIPERAKNALAFSFDTTVGRKYGTDVTIHDQYEYYHRPDNRYTFPDWKFFNERVTSGGVSRKKLNMVIAGTNTGKTLLLVNIALQHLKSGLNVLYLTGEDGEERITERVDGNILSIDTNKLFELNESMYVQGIRDVMNKSEGTLIIKEFAAKKLSVRGIERLLEELQLKENFVPDVICLDYLTLLKSDMITHINNTNSYYTSVAEELRGLATEKNVVVWTCLQFNRNGLTSSDPEMTDIADAIGIAFTGDLVVAVLENSELKEKNQYLLKQLKNRYTPIKPQFERWLMGVNKDRQQIFEIEAPQEGLKESNMVVQPSNDELKIETLTKNVQSDDDAVYSNFKF